jgi:uncharacterized protein (TIGR02147 family)
MNVFNYDDYKSYLRAAIKESPERGYLTKLAAAAGCQKSYFTQVLHHHVHFTPEHATSLCRFWNFDDNEEDYFIELVNYARAGTQLLRHRIQKRLTQIKDEKLTLAKRFKASDITDEESRAFYYSSWLISAIHMAITIPDLQTVKSLSRHFRSEENEISKILEQLYKFGLAAKKGSAWVTTNKMIHLPRNSVFTSMNHLNWRNQALIDSQQHKKDSIHYTSITSLSKSDFYEIQQLVLKFIDQKRKIITPSKEEVLGCFTCDWFEV